MDLRRLRGYWDSEGADATTLRMAEDQLLMVLAETRPKLALVRMLAW